MKYFAYGANMDPVNMARRCPGARAIGRALLREHRLEFRRWRAWRTGVGHVEPAAGESVWGVLWEIDGAHERRLDRYEAVHRGLYTKANVTVEHDGEPVEAMVYLATPKAEKRPSARYLGRLIRGARAYELPPPYIERLQGLRRPDLHLSSQTCLREGIHGETAKSELGLRTSRGEVTTTSGAAGGKTMRKWLRILVPIAVLGLMPSTAHAGSQTGTYVAAGAVSSGAGSRCVSQAGTCVAALGMAVIPAGPSTISVRIVDTSGPGQAFSVCQHNSTDPATPLCGDGVGDVRYDGCATGAAKSYSGFKPGASILISVFAVSIDCEGTGTVGTYSVSW